MVTTNWANSRRRARGRLRTGGESRSGGGNWLGAGFPVWRRLRPVVRARRRAARRPAAGVAPQQADQGQVAVQPRPGAPLVVAQPELLLAVLMEALDRPPLVGQPGLAGQRPVVQAPGEVPLRLAVVARQRALADQPAQRAGHVAVGAMDPHPARLRRACPRPRRAPSRPPTGPRAPLGQRRGRGQRRDLDRVRVLRPGAPAAGRRAPRAPSRPGACGPGGARAGRAAPRRRRPPLAGARRRSC